MACFHGLMDRDMNQNFAWFAVTIKIIKFINNEDWI